MKRAATIVTFAALALGIVGLVALRVKVLRPPPAYPCVDTSREGWLTAVGGSLMLRVEWAPGTGRVGVAPERGVVAWREITDADARKVAQQVLAPLSEDVSSSSGGTVSFFVGCDGRGEYWRDTSGTPLSWRECIHPVDETRLECARRVLIRRPSVEQVAGAVADRIAEQARLVNVQPASARLDY